MENKEIKLYLGGSLFSESEGNKRLLEEKQINDIGGFDIYNPISAPCNDKSKLPTAKDIFVGDTTEILNSDVTVFDLSNPTDLGVAMELGVVWGLNYMINLLKRGIDAETILSYIPTKIILTHLSDIRKNTANQYEGHHIPWGYNQYVVGGIESMNGYIGDKFDGVLEELNKIKKISSMMNKGMDMEEIMNEITENEINDLEGEEIDE